MRRLVPCIVWLVVLAACVDEADAPSTSATEPQPTSTTTPVETTQAPTTTAPEGACPPGDVMLADGGLADFDPSSSDSTRIAGITWRTSGVCQTFTISFATEDGAPATTPPALSARLLRGAGVLRIETAATDSVIADQVVETGLVERLFVPVSDDGSRFVDLVLGEPVVARARLETTPARVEIEIQPGGPPIGRPLMTGDLVVIEPGSAAVATPVLDVAGYSMGEASTYDVTINRAGQPVADTTLETADSHIWSAFHLVVQVGDDAYDMLQVTDDEGSVVAAIPFNR